MDNKAGLMLHVLHTLLDTGLVLAQALPTPGSGLPSVTATVAPLLGGVLPGAPPTTSASDVTNQLVWGGLASHALSIADARREEAGQPLKTSHKATLALLLCFIPAILIFVVTVFSFGLEHLASAFWGMLRDGMGAYGGAFSNYTAQSVARSYSPGAPGAPPAGGPPMALPMPPPTMPAPPSGVSAGPPPLMRWALPNMGRWSLKVTGAVVAIVLFAGMIFRT